MTTKQKLSTRLAIAQVLAGGKPMKVPAIIEQALPLTGLAGKTPGQTCYSVLYGESKKATPAWVQVGRGEFKLATASKAPAAKATTKAKVASKPIVKKPAVKRTVKVAA